MPARGKRGKPKRVSHPSHRPWKSLRDFHIPTASTTFSYEEARPNSRAHRINNFGWAKLNRRSGPSALAKRTRSCDRGEEGRRGARGCTAETGFPSSGFSGRVTTGYCGARTATDAKYCNLQLQLAGIMKDGDWVYTDRDLKTRIEIPATISSAQESAEERL